MDTRLESRARDDVLKGAKAIFSRGLVESGEGNVSARVPGKDEMFITPAFNDYGTLSKDDVVHIDFLGNKLSGGRNPSSEYRLHAAVYRARPGAMCVIHTHSTHAAMLSVTRSVIPVILEEMIIFLGGQVNVSKYAQANTDELGVNAVKAMGRSNGILMANHGVLVCGRSMEHAVKMAELVEKMANVYAGALRIGKPKTIPKKSFPKFLEHFESEFATH